MGWEKHRDFATLRSRDRARWPGRDFRAREFRVFATRGRVRAPGPARGRVGAARCTGQRDNEGHFLFSNFRLLSAFSFFRSLIFPLSDVKTPRGRKRPRVVSSLSAVRLPFSSSVFPRDARCARRALCSAAGGGRSPCSPEVGEVGEVGEVDFSLALRD